MDASAIRSLDRPAARLVAFHLPQFHPVPENDQWWGKGFTEWTNVARSKPLFRGHYQPRLPADLGYYDLRLPETRQAQAELASSYGIEGFCYWHYWFHGKRLLERPVDDILASGEPDFPFCLAWANESWSRSWLGDEREILIEQKYSEQDDRAHARWLARAFADPRYIHVHGRPMLVIYKPMFLPDARRTTDIFRDECRRLGEPEPYLVGIDAHCPGTDMRQFGFDTTEHHEPQLGVLGPDAFDDRPNRTKLARNFKKGVLDPTLKIWTYREAVELMAQVRPTFPHFPCCIAGWDNTPRRGRHAIVMVDPQPEVFRTQLSLVTNSVLHKDPEERIVFINAWNEWAEGMYLEPDAQFGHAYLNAVSDVLKEARLRSRPVAVREYV
jgi:lipopolysaccharide biosynthesis protein